MNNEKKFIVKRVIFIAAVIVSSISLVIVSRKISINSGDANLTEVSQGPFKITVSAVGELIAENSIDIKGPMLPNNSNRRGRGRRRNIRAMNLKILDIVPEGTIVGKGDYIAQLDRTNYENTLKDELERLENMKTNLEMMVLDTAMTLTSLRNEIRNQTFAVEEASVTLEQSVYEPPATIRQAEIALDKEKRNFKQKKKIYNLRLQQQVKDINDIQLDISRQTRLISDLENYLEGFTITSPADGMVIYKRNWNGTRRETGSTINPFDMVVATLPNLSSMVSKTHISEIEISKIKTGQEVNIKVDAFRRKAYTGKVISIVRIGELLPNSDTKVFEVMIRLDQQDPNLRPSMTTSNEITIKSIDNATYIPLESVRADNKGFTYVYTHDKTKQVVILGESNDKDIIVEKGLEPGTGIYLVRPGNYWKFKLAGENLMNENVKSHEEQAYSETSN